MNFKRICRTLICLVLVCALLVSVSPIKARAAVSEALLISAGVAIGSVMLGLGVGMAADSTPDVMLDTINGCKDFLTLNYSFVTDEDKIQVWGSNPDITVSDTPYYVAQEFVQAVRDYLFDFGVIAESMTTVSSFGGVGLQALSSDEFETGKAYFSQFDIYSLANSSLSSSFFLTACNNPDVGHASGFYGLPLIYNSTVGVSFLKAQYFGNLDGKLTTAYEMGEFVVRSDLPIVTSTEFGGSNYGIPRIYLSYSDACTVYAKKTAGEIIHNSNIYFLTDATTFEPTYSESTSYYGSVEFSNLGMINITTGGVSTDNDGYMVASYSLGSGGGIYPVLPAESTYTNVYTHTVPTGLSAGYIGASSISLDQAYADWAAGTITLPRENAEDNVVIGYPVGLGLTTEETLALSQTDVWQGLGVYNSTGGEITNPDDSSNNNNSGLTFGDVTVTTFLARLLADLTGAFLGDSPKTLTELLGSQMVELRAMLGDLRSAIVQALTDLGTYIQSLPQAFSNFFTQNLEALQTHFSTLSQSLESLFTQLGELIQTGFGNLTELLAPLFEDLKTGLLDGVKTLFVPDADYLTDRVNALRAEFAFADSIVGTAQALNGGLVGVTTEPPVIYIDLGATRGSYDIGGKVPFLDLRWYSEYKSTVDTIISAFLWICFAWRMMIKLPGIINGMPGDFVMASAHQMGLTDYLPKRSKEYEMQRVSNREMIRKGPDK